MVRVEGGVTWIDHTIVLGRRQAIAGIEQALIGHESRRRRVRYASILSRLLRRGGGRPGPARYGGNCRTLVEEKPV